MSCRTCASVADHTCARVLWCLRYPAGLGPAQLIRTPLVRHEHQSASRTGRRPALALSKRRWVETPECEVTLPDHVSHRHSWFGLSCGEYEALLAACGQRCQTCSVRSVEAPMSRLVIDHDGSVGNWAVRGLICQPCNAWLRYDRPDPEWALGYLADPWYLRMLAEHGLTADPPEPSVSRVLDFFDKPWRRYPTGWSTGHPRRIPLTWQGLVQMFGPRNLTPVPSEAALVRSGNRVVNLWLVSGCCRRSSSLARP